MGKKRPLLLDLFCGAGGCAVGYHRAGFDVVGVDHKLQPRYPFGFVHEDALAILDYLCGGGSIYHPSRGVIGLGCFSVIHASPPCQRYSMANNIHGRSDHPDLIAPVRDALICSGRPYIIENVPGAPLRMAVQICGLALSLGVRRHRLFESNVILFGTECGDHSQDYAIVFGGGARGRTKQIGLTKKGGPILRRPTLPIDRAKRAMGIDWMTGDELSQAIPPPYTEFLGKQLIRAIH